MILLMIVISGCHTEQTRTTFAKSKTGQKLNVVATISMITDIVNNVGG